MVRILNHKVLKELVKFVKEQRKMNIELRKLNVHNEKRLQAFYALLSQQSEELADLKRQMRLTIEWLKDHEVRLRGLEA